MKGKKTSSQQEYLQADFCGLSWLTCSPNGEMILAVVLTPRFHDELSAVVDVEFSIDIEDVFLDRTPTKDEVTGDLPVGRATQHQLQDDAFTRSEQLQERIGLGNRSRQHMGSGLGEQPVLLVPAAGALM